MMSVQKRMIPKEHLIRLVVLLSVPNYGNLLLEAKLAKMSFGELSDLRHEQCYIYGA